MPSSSAFERTLIYRIISYRYTFLQSPGMNVLFIGGLATLGGALSLALH